MKDDMKKVFLKHFKIKIDKKLYNELRAFRIKWSQKDPSYIHFLSGNLTGVQSIRFSSLDDAELFSILKLNQNALEKDLHALEEVNPEWKVSSNVTYLTLLYIMHEYSLNKDKKLSVEGRKEAFYIFSFKALGSMFFGLFRRPVSIATAKAVYENMSRRFIIKKEGSWFKAIEYRSKEILDEGVYKDRIREFASDDVGDIAAGIQGAYKSMILYIYDLIMKIDGTSNSISTSSIIENMEDGKRIKDDIDSPFLFTNYLKSIVENTNDFIDEELTYLVTYTVRNISEDLIIDTLKYYSNNFDSKNDYIIKQVIENSISYLRSKGILEPKKDILDTLIKLKGYWSSGNSENKLLKEDLRTISFKAVNRKTAWLINGLSISVILYIFLRAIVKK